MDKKQTVLPNSIFSHIVDKNTLGSRLDKFLSEQYPNYSRSFFQRLIDNQCITINGKKITKSSIILKEKDVVQVEMPTSQPALPPLEPTEIPRDIPIIFKHEHFMVINKPAKLLVHTPNHASTTPTLVDWITANHKEIALTGQADRPGIVHRLDKDTSGILIIGRTNYAHAVFGTLFEQRAIHKTYWAVVHGHPSKEGSIDLSIGRSPAIRTKMTTIPAGQPTTIKVRKALTHYTVLEYFAHYSLVEVKPVTGRTHQIRVHFAAIGHPLIGDIVYGNSSEFIDRQALHAHSIAFKFDNEEYALAADIPEDFKKLLTTLRSFAN